MDKIVIGKIVNVVGLKGEVKVYSYAEEPDRFERLEKIFLGTEEKTLNMQLQRLDTKGIW